MSIKIIVTDKVDPVLINNLENSNFEVDYFPEITHGELLDRVGKYDAIVVRSRTKITSEIVKRSANMKVVARAGVGLDGIAIEDLKASNIAVMSAPEASTTSVAELTIGMMICASRNIQKASLETKNMIFRKETGIELNGKTLGIVGMGRIGFRVAQIAKTLGMNIVYYDLFPNKERAMAIGARLLEVKELMAVSDFIGIFVTVKKGDKPILGREELDCIKHGAIIINTSRASAIDGEQLLSKLKTGNVAFYSADVLMNEPPKDEWEKELINLDNVLITPHIGAQTAEAQRAIAVSISEKIVDFFGGRK